MNELVLLVSVVVSLIHSEVVQAVEQVRQLVLMELKQRMSIVWVEPDVLTKECSWLAELVIQQEHAPVPKAKELHSWQHSIGMVLLVGPDEYVVETRYWRESSHHGRDKREAILWP